jgi:hypothetical protein
VSGRCKDEQRTNVTDVSGNQCTASTSEYQGVYDLSGSLGEWVNLCTKLGECVQQGGSYNVIDESYLTCDALGKMAMMTTNILVGLRCCADAIPPP